MDEKHGDVTEIMTVMKSGILEQIKMMQEEMKTLVHSNAENTVDRIKFTQLQSKLTRLEVEDKSIKEKLNNLEKVENELSELKLEKNY
eukprot:UN05965